MLLLGFWASNMCCLVYLLGALGLAVLLFRFDLLFGFGAVFVSCCVYVSDYVVLIY